MPPPRPTPAGRSSSGRVVLPWCPRGGPARRARSPGLSRTPEGRAVGGAFAVRLSSRPSTNGAFGDQGRLRDRRDPPARRGAVADAQLVRPERYGEAEGLDPGRGDRRPGDQAHGPRARDGRRRELQQRVGRARRPRSTSRRPRRGGASRSSASSVRTPRASSTSLVGVSNVSVGDEVVVHAGQWDLDDRGSPRATTPGRPVVPGVGLRHVLGLVRAVHEGAGASVPPKAERLTWEEAAAPTLTGATAYRMLHGWPPNTVKEDDVVLVGRLGGTRLARDPARRARGATPVAVVSSAEKGSTRSRSARRAASTGRRSTTGGCRRRGTPGLEGVVRGREGVRQGDLGVLGERRGPNIVFEHPGQDTVPTSIFVCERGGMVVICAGRAATTRWWTCATSGTRRSGTRARTCSTTSRLRRSTTSSAEGKVHTTLGRTFAYESPASRTS